MTDGDGRRRREGLRLALSFGVVAVLLLGALFSAIGALNRDMYSAPAFARQYLDAVARHDTAGALALAGVRPTDRELRAAGLRHALPDTLLRASALGALTDITLTRDTEVKPGIHALTFSFRLDGAKSSMDFSVARAGTFAGVFTSWKFSTSPLSMLEVTVLHHSTFTVNRLTLDARAHADASGPATFSNRAAYLAFAPAVYTFNHTSTLLSAPRAAIAVTKSGVTDVTVDAQPNAAFIAQVQKELDAFLDTCTTQQVLQPSNCPFGIVIDDRVKGLPTWSIGLYPPVTLVPGDGTFDMPATGGTTHIVVKVQSLFDGEVSTRDEDVPFTVSLAVAVNADGSLNIQLH